MTAPRKPTNPSELIKNRQTPGGQAAETQKDKGKERNDQTWTTITGGRQGVARKFRLTGQHI